MFVILFLLVFGLNYSAGVIQHLSDFEYNRMPPVYDLDNYDQCMMKDGTYCTAEVMLFADNSNDLITLITEYSVQIYKHYNHSVIERGVCVTRNCQKFLKSNEKYTEKNLSKPLEACINETIWNEYGLQTKLLDYNCVSKNEERIMDLYDYMFLYFLYSLLLLNIAGTICDTIVRRQNLEKKIYQGPLKYLMCFSITQNWRWLVSAEPEDPRLRKLKAIHAVKSMLMYMFIMGHSYYIFHTFIGNSHTFEKLYETIIYRLIMNGMMSVQVLLCISGFLLVYHLLIESEKRVITWTMVPKLIALRLWRLTPANLTYVIFSATMFRYWGQGPLWKTYVTNRASGDCRKYWWSHLLFINNYIPDNRFCVVQSWQLSADFQLFIVGLCLFIATKASRRVLVFSSLVLLGMTSMALHIWWSDLEPFVILSPELFRKFNTANYDIRQFGHVNFPGFSIGMLTGHYVYKLQKEKVDFSKYKPVLGPLLNIIVFSVIVLMYTGSCFYEDRASLTLRILFGTLLDPMMALIMSYGIFAMVFRFNESWSNFMEKDVWLIPGRLTYSVSLIHTFFLINLLASRKYLIEVSIFNHCILHNGVAAMSFIFAIPFCIMVEAPFNKLLKVIVSKETQVKKVE